MKREITLNTNLFQDFVEWFLYYQIFDERELKYTKHQFWNILSISNDKIFDVTALRKFLIDFVFDKPKPKKEVVLKPEPVQIEEEEDLFKMMSTRVGAPNIKNFLDEKSFEKSPLTAWKERNSKSLNQTHDKVWFDEPHSPDRAL